MTTAPQPPHAPVLRRHREMALVTIFPATTDHAVNRPDEIERWLGFGGDYLPGCNRVAQLAADCEARGEPGALNRAWEEGRQAAPYCSARQERPHGGGITHYECKACEYGDVRYPGDEDWDDSAPTEPAIVNPYPKADEETDRE